MKSLLRRNLLILMLGVTAGTLTLSAYSPAFAKDGHSDSGSSSDDGGNSGSGGDSDSDSEDDSSGSGSDSGSDDDSSGNGSDDDNSGSGGSDDGPGHDSGDDSNDDNGGNSGGGNGGNSSDDNSSNTGGGGQRPVATLSLDAASLAGVRNGSLVVVDNLGRVLEVEIDRVNGRQVVTGKPHGGDARRNPGPIASVRVIPVSQSPVHQ